MRWNGLFRKAGGRRAIGLPSVPSMTDPAATPAAKGSADDSDRRPIDRTAVQYLDRVRAIYRPAHGAARAPGLERFIGREDLFRHIGTTDGAQPMMECPVHWPASVKWVPIRDLEILEILEDQDVRAG
jgi:hypothetical protein